MKNILKTSLDLTIEVEVKYENLPADIEHGLPEQTDLVSVTFNLLGSKGRKRKVDILQLLSETEILSLEDQIEERGE
jgi:hypothetical protein